MEQLRAPQSDAVRRLIPSPEQAGHTAFAHAVLGRKIAGRVFVDRSAAPASAIICPDNGFLITAGEPSGELAVECVAALMGDALRTLPEARVLVATSASWDAALGAILPVRRTRLEFRSGIHLPVRPAPAGYSIKPVDEASASRFGQGIDPWVVRTLGGPNRFMQRSFGYAALTHDAKLAAACVACAVGGGEAEIEIGTDPRHRRRGLAVAVAAAFMDECRGRGLTPAWTCDSSNEASIRTARRLGFEPFREVGVFPLDPRLIFDGSRWRLLDEFA